MRLRDVFAGILGFGTGGAITQSKLSHAIGKELPLKPEAKRNLAISTGIDAIGTILAYYGGKRSSGMLRAGLYGLTLSEAIGTISSALLLAAMHLSPELFQTKCVRCGETFSFTSLNEPVWCPKCGTEQIVRK